MSYGSTAAALWDAREFRQLCTESKLLWYYLMTGPEAARSAPGLLQVGIAGLAETIGVGTTDIANGLAQLEGDHWILFDGPGRLLRVMQDVYKPAPNHNVVAGWWRYWRDLPNHPFKHAHLPFLRGLCRGKMAATWDKHFGSVGGGIPPTAAEPEDPPSSWLFSNSQPIADQAPDLFSVDAPGATLELVEMGSECIPKPINGHDSAGLPCVETHSECISKPISETTETRSFVSLGMDSEIHRIPDTRDLTPDTVLASKGGVGGGPGGQVPGEDTGPPDATSPAAQTAAPFPVSSGGDSGWLGATGPPGAQPPSANHEFAAELWDFQEKLRAEVPGMIARPPLPADLDRVLGALEAFPADQLRHAQRVFAAQARASPEKRRYFDGITNWAPAALLHAVGMAVPDETHSEGSKFTGESYEGTS